MDYDGGKYFSVKIVSADGKVAASGVSVKFTINGKSTTVTTDADGIAKIKITDVPKKYTMKTTFNGKTVKNIVSVKQVLKAKKVTVKKTAKKFTLKATLKINGKLVKGKQITFKFNGKTYKVKTNAKGIAQKTLNKKVIKKLKKGKTYTVQGDIPQGHNKDNSQGKIGEKNEKNHTGRIAGAALLHWCGLCQRRQRHNRH